ncbi:MAG: hypothetical protein EXR86_10955 [Gammaproteobacteria bacterium]|nr:hypothetical protein [Gammaproteobacteria bacterium]
MNRRMIVGLGLLATTISSAFGADATGNYAVWGIGQASCNQYTRAYESDAVTDYKHYLSGYLTAFNTVAEGVYQGTKTNSLGDHLKSIYGYCGSHRLDSFERAIQALLAQTANQSQAQTDLSSRWGRPPKPATTP